jgi:hypothetical protein
MSTELLETCRGFNKHIIEEIVRQFVYLPEYYEDARSEIYIKKICYLSLLASTVSNFAALASCFSHSTLSARTMALSSQREARRN